MGLSERWAEMVEAAAEAEVRAACRPPLVRTLIDASLFKPITRITDAETGEVYAIRRACDSADEDATGSDA